MTKFSVLLLLHFIFSSGLNIVPHKKRIMKEQTLRLQAPWDEVREKLKENNLELTDEDLDYKPGKENELLERLSAKMKKDPAAVKALVESISANEGKAS